MKKALAIFVAIIIGMTSACSRNPETNNIKRFQAEDQGMNAAIAKAKETSADFVRAFHKQQAGTNEFYVKKPYTAPSNGAEHMWISVTSEANGVFTGVIANDAEITKEVKMGDTVSVNISEISDWKYMDGNKMIGGYTIRYYLSTLSPKEREKFLKDAGFEM